MDIVPGPRPEWRQAVIRGLVGYNTAQAGREGWESLELFAVAADGSLAGGLIGNTHWGWLFINQLWVDERCRRAGLGRRLVAAAEAQARARGCVGAWLDTFDFQARGFYEKAGFTVFATLDGFPPGHQRIFLRKELSG